MYVATVDRLHVELFVIFMEYIYRDESHAAVHADHVEYHVKRGGHYISCRRTDGRPLLFCYRSSNDVFSLFAERIFVLPTADFNVLDPNFQRQNVSLSETVFGTIGHCMQKNLLRFR